MLITFPKQETPRDLIFVRELEEFEGPILTEYRAASGSGLYIEKLCTRDGNIKRYLLVRTEQRAIAEYLAGKITMIKLLTDHSDGGGFIIDKTNGTRTASYSVRLSEIPAEYLPSARAMHDDSLRPNWVTIPQNFLISSDWDAKLLAMIERQFLNLAGFAHFAEPGKGRKIPHTALNYDYDGGYTIMHLFNKIRAAVPAQYRSKSVGVSAASPGVLTVDAPAEIVNQLSKSFNALLNSSTAYDNLHSWSKLTPRRIDALPTHAYTDLEELCRSLEIDIESLFPAPTDDVPNPKSRKEAILVAGKLAAAYYRRLWQILKPEARVEFISAKTPTLNAPLPPNAYGEGDDEDEI